MWLAWNLKICNHQLQMCGQLQGQLLKGQSSCFAAKGISALCNHVCKGSPQQQKPLQTCISGCRGQIAAIVATQQPQACTHMRALSLIGRVSNCQLGLSQFESGRARSRSVEQKLFPLWQRPNLTQNYRAVQPQWLHTSASVSILFGSCLPAVPGAPS